MGASLGEPPAPRGGETEAPPSRTYPGVRRQSPRSSTHRKVPLALREAQTQDARGTSEECIWQEGLFGGGGRGTGYKQFSYILYQCITKSLLRTSIKNVFWERHFQKGWDNAMSKSPMQTPSPRTDQSQPRRHRATEREQWLVRIGFHLGAPSSVFFTKLPAICHQKGSRGQVET